MKVLQRLFAEIARNGSNRWFRYVGRFVRRRIDTTVRFNLEKRRETLHESLNGYR